MRFLVAMLLPLTIAACRGSELISPIPAHSVVLTMAAPGPCVSGTCDPGGNNDVLALIRIVNHGTATAYLQACGARIALETQQFVNGAWVSAGLGVACAFPSTPIALAPGDTIQTNENLTPGRWRVTLGVASGADLSDEALATSGAVIVF
jgi:hypothetical protein